MAHGQTLRHLVHSRAHRSVQLEPIGNNDLADIGWSQTNGRPFHSNSNGKPLQRI